MIPAPTETRSVSILVYDDAGVEIVSRCVVKDVRTIQEIYRCLTPYEISENAAGLMRSGPIIGKLGINIEGPRETTWIEFADAGMNPLCFRVEQKACLRGGATYTSYRSDHERLYGIDSERVDEGKMLYEKLIKICNTNLLSLPPSKYVFHE